MDQSTKSISMRTRILRGLLIVTVAANLTTALFVLPMLIPWEFRFASSLSDLARVSEGRNHDGRVVGVVLYETYQASKLIMTASAADFLGLDGASLRRWAQLTELHIVDTDQIPEDLIVSRAELKTETFGPPQKLRSAVYMTPATKTVETVYAFLVHDKIVFVPELPGGD